jgi:formylglycine-generating enzyme required for sulfatase activity
MTACTNGFTSVYPWGNSVGADPERCNTEQLAASCITSRAVCGVLPAGEKTNCRTPGGVVDMLGNVAEWAFSCNLLDADQTMSPTGCMVLGGGYDTGLISCNVERTLPNDTRSPSLGFRCCADLTLAEELQLAKR